MEVAVVVKYTPVLSKTLQVLVIEKDRNNKDTYILRAFITSYRRRTCCKPRIMPIKLVKKIITERGTVMGFIPTVITFGGLPFVTKTLNEIIYNDSIAHEILRID